MDFEKQNIISEGVGKRIIEALKMDENAEIEVNPAFEPHDNNQNDSASADSFQETEYKDFTYSYESESTGKAFDKKEYTCNEEYTEQKTYNNDNFESTNIDILVDLVTKLPSGVTKQTGAQIIRHTMEAMGIPLNKVLSNAQRAQEDLEQDIKNNINTIEEYRAKIKVLDQEIQRFRKKAHDLEDIISLFILADKK